MALTKYKLGQLIELSEARNSEGKYGIDAVKGISIKKMFIETKADMEGVGLKPYLVVSPNDFAYVTVTSRNGEKITLAHNTTEETFIVSSSYVVFRVCRTDLLNSDWLFMYFNRPEFDRYARFNSWGSARETFSWDDMRDIDIDLPPLSVQENYVAVYNSMVANLKAYEKGLADLKLACDATIEELRRKHKSQRIGPYLQPVDERNSSLTIRLSQGISTEKKFTDSKQVAEDKKNAKIVRPGQFAYNRATTRNGDKISIALREGEPCVVSSAYQVFEVADKSRLDPHYLMLWFTRSEFDRYARYHSKGSAHEFFEYADMEDVEFPIPTLEEQECVSSIYKTYVKRMELKNVLEGMIRSLCPILIKDSLEEGKRM